MQWYLIREVAELLKLSTGTVYSLIHSGKLEAVNYTPSSKKANWRISEEHLTAYQRQNTNIKPEKQPKRKKQRQTVPQYFS